MIFTHSLKNTSHKTLKRLIFWGCCLPLGIFIMGYFALDLASDYGEKIERNSLLAQARLAAASVDPTLVKSLKGVPEDVGTQAYQHIRSILTRMIKTNKDLRFIYLMGFKRDQIIFLVDTEPLTSPDFSPPGQVYDEATPKLVDSFTDMISFVEGPYEDRWGVWVSAFVPIIYPENTEGVHL